MKHTAITRFASIAMLLFTTTLLADNLHGDTWLYTQTSDTQKSMTPDKALQMLKEGNNRFIQGKSKARDLLQQAKLTNKKGQYPFAVILSCMDSRGSPEIIFDQGIGDVFSVRLAGNVLDRDQLGGLEYATKAIGSHLIVVMGHTRCGAVSGACSKVELGNLTQLLQKIDPAIAAVKLKKQAKTLNCQDPQIIDDIAKQNILDVIQAINKESKIIHDLIASGAVRIVGAMHDLHTGEVTFIDT